MIVLLCITQTNEMKECVSLYIKLSLDVHYVLRIILFSHFTLNLVERRFDGEGMRLSLNPNSNLICASIFDACVLRWTDLKDLSCQWDCLPYLFVSLNISLIDLGRYLMDFPRLIYLQNISLISFPKLLLNCFFFFPHAWACLYPWWCWQTIQ